MREKAKVGVESVGLEMQSHAKCIAGKSYFRHGEERERERERRGKNQYMRCMCVCVCVCCIGEKKWTIISSVKWPLCHKG